MLAELRPGPDPAGLVLNDTDVTIDPAITTAWQRVIEQAPALLAHTFSSFHIGRETKVILSRGALYLATDCFVHGQWWRLAIRVPDDRWQLAHHHRLDR